MNHCGATVSYLLVRLEQNVLRLDVPVDDALGEGRKVSATEETT